MNSVATAENECKAGLHRIEDLEFVKLRFARAIPVELIENVKGRTFTPEQFYRYQAANVDNPLNHLYVLIDDRKVIHGYLWAEGNALDGSLFVNTFSISKDYWNKGTAISKAIEFLREFKVKVNATRVFWCSTNEKFFQKHGFKRSKITLLEYNDPPIQEEKCTNAPNVSLKNPKMNSLKEKEG